MEAVATEAIANCATCGLPFALRKPRPGETASSWACRFCKTRYFAVLQSDAPRALVENVNPAEDVNPRVIVDGDTIAMLYKRAGITGRIIDQRKARRADLRMDVTICAQGRERDGRLLDVSAGGLSVVIEHPVPVDAMLAVRFDPLPGAPVRRGIVRSTISMPEAQFRIGIEFLD